MTKARDLANAGTALTSVSATELGYLDGVTSAVQTQIDGKIGQSTAINPTIVDAKGDIIAATAADTVARLAVGTNGHLLTADSSTATGLKWAAAPAGGKVLQVVSGTSTTATTVTSTTTYGDLGLSLSITPTSATSKIMVFICQNIYNSRSSASSVGYAIRLMRDATAVFTPAIGNYQSGYIAYSGTSGNWGMYNTFNMSYLDSPATTSAITYKTQGLCNGGNVIGQESSNSSSIVLMEIGA